MSDPDIVLTRQAADVEYDVTTNRTRRLVSVVFHLRRLALAQIDMTPEQLDAFVQQLQEAKASLPPAAEQPP